MAGDVVTKQMLVRVYVDAQTQELKVYEADMNKVNVATEKARKSQEQLEMRMLKQQRAMDNVRDSMAKLPGPIGAASNAMIGLNNQMEDLEFSAKKAGTGVDLFNGKLKDSYKAIGLLGTIGLVVATFKAAWDFGRQIDTTLKLGDAVKRLTDYMDQARARNPNSFGAILADVSGYSALPGADVDTSKLFAHDTMADAAKAGFAKERERQDVILRNSVGVLGDYRKEMNEWGKDVEKNNEKATAASKKYHDELIKLLHDEAKVYADIQEQESQKQLEELNQRLDAVRQFEMGFADMARKNGLEAAKIGEEMGATAQQAQDEFSDFFMNIAEDNGRAMDSVAESMQDTANEAIDIWRNAIGMIAGFLDKLVGGLGSAFGNIAGFIKGGLSGGPGGLFGSIKGMFSGAGGAAGFLGNMTNMMGWVNMAVTGVTALIGVFKKLFAHDWGKDVQNVIQQFGIVGDISDELAKKLEEDAKKLNDAGSAAVVNLGAIMDELGVTEDTFPGFVNTLLYGFEAVGKGFLTAQQQAEALATAFPQLADAAIQFGGAFIDQLGLVIAKMKETGIGMETLQSYFDGLKQKIADIRSAALEDLITNLGKLTDMVTSSKGGGGIKQLQSYLASALTALKASGASTYEIWQKLGPMWEQIAQKLKDLGQVGSKEFQDMSKQFEMFQKHAAAFAKLDLVSKITTDLARMGVLTQQAFEHLESTIFNTFKKITGMTNKEIFDMAKNGFGANNPDVRAGLEAMLPQLVQILGLHNQLGMALSAQDKALIKLAQDYGLLPKDTSQVGLDPTLTALNAMLDVLKLIAEALGVSLDLINQIGATPPPDWSKWNASNYFGGEAIRRDSLQGAEVITQDYTPRILDHGEIVLGRTASRNYMRGATGGNNSGSTSVQIVINDAHDPHRTAALVQDALDKHRVKVWSSNVHRRF